MNDVNGFIKAEGRKLKNGEGREILLRGVGLGNWLLPEGYMWCFPNQGDRPRRIERMIQELIGEDKSKLFWETYYERYISEDDIRQIATAGFNSVRVPINSRFLFEGDEKTERYNECHLKYIDTLIDWCKTYQIYVILDLHGAPGGQTGANIDDSENDQPDLFTYERNKQLTVALWRMLARRYKDEWIVAGYDLLNEPLPEWFSAHNGEVMPLYQEITKAIREVDDRHMIILEGVHWATDWSIFKENIDGNLMLQFHKYWNNPDTESIQVYLDKGAEWDVPIFMGEGGENNNDWYTGAFRLFEDYSISWNFWTWKKMNTNNSPCSINMPSGWELLVDFLKGVAIPDKEVAEATLWGYLENISFKRCMYKPEVVNSIFRRPPVRIPAIFYGYRGDGISFKLTARSDQNIGFRVNDGTGICFIEDTKLKLNFHHGRGEPWQPDEWLCLQFATGDWYAYEFVVDEAATFSVDLNVCAPPGNAQISAQVNGITIEMVEIKKKAWETVRLKKQVHLEPGLHRIVLKAEESLFCVKWLEVNPF